MKKILSLLIIISVLALGCTQADVQQEERKFFTMTLENSDVKPDFPESQIRLTSHGFEADQLTVRQEESLTIIIRDNLNGHYITASGARLAEKQLFDGEKVNIGFDSIGTYEIIDENSKSSLTVHVI